MSLLPKQHTLKLKLKPLFSNYVSETRQKMTGETKPYSPKNILKLKLKPHLSNFFSETRQKTTGETKPICV